MISRMFVFGALIGIPLLLFLPILQGQIPFPGAFQRAWYEPWKSDTAVGGFPKIPHKPLADDIFRQIYPFKHAGTNQIKQGLVPLWNPWNGAGQPLLATMHTGILHPIHLMLMALSPTYGWALIVYLQFPFVGVGLYLYLRSLKLSQGAATAGAVIFILSGVMVVRSLYTDYIWALGILPYILTLLERQRRISQLVIPLLIALLIFSVQPQIIVYILLLLVLYSTFRFSLISSQTLRLLIYFILGLLLSSVQLIPTIELYIQANVTPEASKLFVTKFLVPLGQLITIVIPNYFGNLGTNNFWGPLDYVETATAIGSMPCTLALFACIRRKFKYQIDTRYFWIAITGGTLALTITSPITRFLYQLPLPILATSIPSRLLLITAFSISVLAGHGYEIITSLENNERKTMLKHIALAIGVIGILFLYTAFNWKTHNPCPLLKQGFDCNTIALRNTIIEVLVFICSSILIGTEIFAKKKKHIVTILFILVLTAIGIYNGRKILPFSPPQDIMPQHDVISALTSLTANTRAVGADMQVATDLATYYQFRDPNYYDPLYIKRYGELISYGKKGNVSGALTRSDIELPSITENLDEQQSRRRMLQLTSTGIEVTR